MDLSRYSLYPHQAEGVQFLGRPSRAILAEDLFAIRGREL